MAYEPPSHPKNYTESIDIVLDKLDEAQHTAIQILMQNGALRERERIIKLLEDNWVEPMDWLSVVALIEGETE